MRGAGIAFTYEYKHAWELLISICSSIQGFFGRALEALA